MGKTYGVYISEAEDSALTDELRKRAVKGISDYTRSKLIRACLQEAIRFKYLDKVFLNGGE